jgi:hypothetical protein
MPEFINQRLSEIITIRGNNLCQALVHGFQLEMLELFQVLVKLVVSESSRYSSEWSLRLMRESASKILDPGAQLKDRS